MRLIIVVSPTFEAKAPICSGVMLNPIEFIYAAALTASLPSTAAGELIAKYSPGLKMHAATSAITPTRLSISIEP